MAGLTFSHGSGDLSVVDADAVLDEVVVEDQGGAVPVVKLNPKLATCGRFNKTNSALQICDARAVFRTLHFLLRLRLGPISFSVCPCQSVLASSDETLVYLAHS